MTPWLRVGCLVLAAALTTGCEDRKRWSDFIVQPPDPPLGKRCRDDTGGPLKDWMKNNLKPPLVRGELAPVAAMLDALVEIAPDAYRDWAYWSAKGARAARQRSTENVLASCRGCHESYSIRYCQDDRARRLEAE